MSQEIVFCQDINNVRFSSKETHIRAHALFNGKTTTGVSIDTVPLFFRTEEPIDEKFYTTSFIDLEDGKEDVTAQELINYTTRLSQLDVEFPIEFIDTYLTDKINYYINYVMDIKIQMESSFTDTADLLNIDKIKTHPYFHRMLNYVGTLIKTNYHNRAELERELLEAKEERDGKYLYAIPLLDIIPTACICGAEWYRTRTEFLKINKFNNIVPGYSVIGQLFNEIVKANKYIKQTGLFVFCYTYKNILGSALSSTTVVCRHDGSYLINPIVDID